MKKPLIQVIGGDESHKDFAQPPSKNVNFVASLIPQGPRWYNRKGELQTIPCVAQKYFAMTAETKPDELHAFLHTLLKHGTFMSGLRSIRDDQHEYSVEQFCGAYSDIPVSLLVPPTYVVTSITSENTQEQILALLDNKVNQLRTLRPVRPEAVEEMLRQLSIEYTHASCHIEGNPLRYKETTLVVSRMLSIAQHAHKHDLPVVPSQTEIVGKQLIQLLDDKDNPVDTSTNPQLKELSEQPYTKIDFQEVKNHKKVVDDFLISAIRSKKIDVQLIKDIHQRLMVEILPTAGQYRTENVRIVNSDFVFPPYEDVPRLMDAFGGELLSKSGSMHPVLLASWAHYTFVGIHPFEDGNGRTARILMNIILVSYDFPISFWPEEAEDVYWSACKLVQSGNDPSHIIRLVCEAVNHSADIYLAVYKNQVSIPTQTVVAKSIASNVKRSDALFF